MLPGWGRETEADLLKPSDCVEAAWAGTRSYCGSPGEEPVPTSKGSEGNDCTFSVLIMWLYEELIHFPICKLSSKTQVMSILLK